jgi:hypothetical protein
MWKYYLLSCAGSFRARINQLWEIVLSPEGIPDGYRPTRKSQRGHPLKGGSREKTPPPEKNRETKVK